MASFITRLLIVGAVAFLAHRVLVWLGVTGIDDEPIAFNWDDDAS